MTTTGENASTDPHEEASPEAALRARPGSSDSLGQDADDLIADLRGQRRPRVFIISGPSGVGKDTVIEQLREHLTSAYFAVTATTRNRRPGEMEGVHYEFLSDAEFRQKLDEGEFLESASVYGNHYGVLRGPARKALAEGKHVFFKVDVQGAAAIRKVAPSAVSIFLAPESAATLLQRLKHRKTDDPAVLMTRFATATRELAAAADFDYVIFNRQDRLDDALQEILAIVRAETVRTSQPRIQL